MIFNYQVVALNFPEDVCIALNNLKSVTVSGGKKVYNCFYCNKLKLIITKFSPTFTLKKQQQAEQVVLI